jgi:hypothetical protein
MDILMQLISYTASMMEKWSTGEYKLLIFSVSWLYSIKKKYLYLFDKPEMSRFDRVPVNVQLTSCWYLGSV